MEKSLGSSAPALVKGPLLLPLHNRATPGSSVFTTTRPDIGPLHRTSTGSTAGYDHFASLIVHFCFITQNPSFLFDRLPSCLEVTISVLNMNTTLPWKDPYLHISSKYSLINPTLDFQIPNLSNLDICDHTVHKTCVVRFLQNKTIFKHQLNDRAAETEPNMSCWTL